MDGIGEAILDTIPDVVTEDAVLPREPGLGWKLTAEALRELESIDENRRLAAAKAGTTFLD